MGMGDAHHPQTAGTTADKCDALGQRAFIYYLLGMAT
jgi:hypothetical protein